MSICTILIQSINTVPRVHSSICSWWGPSNMSKTEYDLFVIGGGSGGLAAAKEAAALGKSVALCDYVVPTPQGTTWGLGGTCLNVGCIPKKLMHQAALFGQALEDCKRFGWQVPSVQHCWKTMCKTIDLHIKNSNRTHEAQLSLSNVVYMNALAEFINPHTLKVTDRYGQESVVVSRDIVLAMGARPRYPDIPGAREFAITSDDLFFLSYPPGKTLIVGASYVALECAGFLSGLGFDVTVMVRSILLRGFDQEMAELVGIHMENERVRFLRPCVPTKVDLVATGSPGILRVTALLNREEIIEEYNTVLFAIGREACTKGLGLDKAGVTINSKNGKIKTKREQTNVPHIYALGDIVEGRPELTPVAIKSAKLLVHRLYGDGDVEFDQKNIPTTIFTPIEYGCVGYSEEEARSRFGESNLEVFHAKFSPLEWQLVNRQTTAYMKIICLKPQDMAIIGFHYFGPNAGEVTQGFAAAVKLGITKADLDATVGIHPTCAEVATTLHVTRRSGQDPSKSSC